ncbi:MAG: hypothetical protein ABI883_06585, partial [Chthoniobacterales bacterium]
MRRSIWITALALSLLARGWNAEAAEAPRDLDSLAVAYAKLVLALGQHDPDYVDAFYGPAEWKAAAEQEKKPLDAIREEAMDLFGAISALPESPEEIKRLRVNYLARQLAALEARVRIVQGARLTFDEESRALYHAVAPTHT